MYLSLLRVEVGADEERAKTRLEVVKKQSLQKTPLHTLFPQAELRLNRRVNSNSNNYVNSALIQTDLTTDTAGKKNWANC